jgi:hypothetical protein
MPFSSPTTLPISTTANKHHPPRAQPAAERLVHGRHACWQERGGLRVRGGSEECIYEGVGHEGGSEDGGRWQGGHGGDCDGVVRYCWWWWWWWGVDMDMDMDMGWLVVSYMDTPYQSV